MKKILAIGFSVLCITVPSAFAYTSTVTVDNKLADTTGFSQNLTINFTDEQHNKIDPACDNHATDMNKTKITVPAKSENIKIYQSLTGGAGGADICYNSSSTHDTPLTKESKSVSQTLKEVVVTGDRDITQPHSDYNIKCQYIYG